MDFLEQMISLVLALVLAVKYVFFEHSEAESSLSIKSPIMIGSPRGGGGASAGAGEGCCRRDPPVGARANGATTHPNCSAPLSLPICRPENGFTEKPSRLKANELNTDLYAYCESSPAEPPVQTPSSSSSSSSPSSSSPLSSSSSTTSFPSSSSDDDPRSLEECLSILADPQ
ncbi:hypothetical protein CRUP_007087, partial [Coryphaenoides rupestris]